MTGMASFDMEGKASSNVNTVNEYSAGGYGILGQGLYVPIFGKAGILVLLGGDQPLAQNQQWCGSLVPMSDITIYDIDSGNFHKEVASGDFPPPRSAICAVGAGSAPGNISTVRTRSSFLPAMLISLVGDVSNPSTAFATPLTKQIHLRRLVYR